ncbi:hypothetical protein O181_074841 [Austropuccinia psidii MF-1]|uniref:Uncharacterized protein n=1 Tax=Austropuccinia psidii MF-1 TaxID=1389203 RepID=A0A9Q3F7C3_9BASI|nr:hypothetical protein [Austropuccinia psidii MF-1]
MEHENHEIPINTHQAASHSQTKEAAIQVEGNQLVSNHEHYQYVPYYSQAPRDISNKINTRNILKEERRSTKKPDQYMIAHVVPYSKATSDPQECAQRKEAMKFEFELLMSHNTRKLVPYPKDSKVIGGMWRITVTGALGQKYKSGLALSNQGTHLEDSKRIKNKNNKNEFL